jgi:hypothetical protein
MIFIREGKNKNLSEIYPVRKPHHLSSTFSEYPAETCSIYDGDTARKCSFVIEGGIKARSFLTGFTFSTTYNPT